MSSVSKSKNKLKAAAFVVAAALIFTSVVFAMFTLSEKRNLKAAKLASLELPSDFTVTAHAGALGTEPNTMESVLNALEFIGEGTVEVDVRFSPSGKPVLSHDEVKSDDTSAPSLEEFFKALKDYPAKANLDLKDFTNLSEISALADKYAVRDKIFFTGVTEDEVQAVREQCPGIPYYLNLKLSYFRINSDKYIDAAADRVYGCGAIGANLNHRTVSEKIVKKLHEKGLLVSVWTVDNEDDMYIALAEAPDNITTKRPDVLLEIIEKQSEK